MALNSNALVVRWDHPTQHCVSGPSASEVEIFKAAQTTYVDRCVRSLPDGYHMVLDDEGANVSAGEKLLLPFSTYSKP